MKQNKLWKAIVIIVALLLVGSWIVPASVFSSEGFSKVGYAPFGLLDIIQAPLRFFDWSFIKTQLSTDGTTVMAYSYVSILLVIFVTGIFYSILNKTGAYGNLIKDIVKKFEKKRKLFFVGTCILFLTFSSVVGINIIAFIFIPFFATILLKLNYSRLSTFVATFLAVLFGNIVSITGTDIVGINNIMYDLTVGTDIVFKGLLFLLFVVVFILYTQYKKEPELELEEIEEKIIEKKEKSYVPIIFLSIFFLIILIVGSYNWYYVFSYSSFYEAYESLMETTIGGYPIAKNIFGMIEPFGYWSGFTISTVLILMGLMISFIYSISFEEIKECASNGIKRMSKVAIYAILSFIPMVMLTQIGGVETFLTTIIGFVYNHITKLAVPFTALATTIYGIFIGDYYALSSALGSIISNSFQENVLSLAVLTMQIMHGLVCLVSPTSLFLVMGLSYLKIPYQKWLSYIWKLFLVLFIFTLGLLLLVNLI